MADDPRIEVAERHIWKGAQAAVTNSVRPHTIGSLRRAAREALAELDAADPLRKLLADEDQAVEFAARARYESATEGWPVADSWADLDEGVRAAWLASVQNLRPVLAALREVAGL